MPTLVLGSPPPELEALMERRRRAGADRFDEVREGHSGLLELGPDRLAELIDWP